MRVAVAMGAAADTAASAAEATRVLAGADAQVSVAALARAELVVATVELESAEELVPTPRDLIHLESQRDDMAGTGKSTMHHERRPADTIFVLHRVCKTEPFQGSLIGRQNIRAATTCPEINRGLALPENPMCSPVREEIAIFVGSVALLPQEVQRDRAALGQGRTSRASIRKHNKECVTGRVKHLDGTMQNVIITITGVIVIIMVMIGGVIIVMPSFLLTGVIGVGTTAGGIPPGDTTHTIPTTIITARSMDMMGYNQRK